MPGLHRQNKKDNWMKDERQAKVALAAAMRFTERVRDHWAASDVQAVILQVRQA